MNVAIDIGNTRTKIAFFEKNEQVDHAFWVHWTLEDLDLRLKGRNIDGVILSASGKEPEQLEAFLKERYFFLRLEHTTALPITNTYKTPRTLGKDRLAAVTGAYCADKRLGKERNNLVIDAGTCVTYDYINQNGEYLGGNISPGLEMRLKAMHAFTAKLPLVEKNETQWGLLGNDTESALRNGAIVGLMAEIKGMAALFRHNIAPMDIILTGGDSEFLMNNIHIKNSFWLPNLVLDGLNDILEYNSRSNN